MCMLCKIVFDILAPIQDLQQNKEMSFPEISFNESMFDNNLMQEYWNRSTEDRTYYEPDNQVEERQLPDDLSELSQLSMEKFRAHWDRSHDKVNESANPVAAQFDFATQQTEERGALVKPKSLSKPSKWQTVWILVSVIVVLLLISYFSNGK